VRLAPAVEAHSGRGRRHWCQRKKETEIESKREHFCQFSFEPMWSSIFGPLLIRVSSILLWIFSVSIDRCAKSGVITRDEIIPAPWNSIPRLLLLSTFVQPHPFKLQKQCGPALFVTFSDQFAGADFLQGKG